MMMVLKLYAICLPVALALDAAWLGVVARGFYRRHLGYLFADNFTWWAACAFYLLHAAGVAYFCVRPAISTGSIVSLVASCIAFGLITYGTYDLTNHATLKDWPLVVTIVDMAWGAFLSTAVGLSGYIVGSRILGR